MVKRMHYCAVTHSAFWSLHLALHTLTVWQIEQRAKGASWDLMGKYNPFTYRTIRIFFVLICNAIYLHLRYILLLCCVNFRLHTESLHPQQVLVFPKSTALSACFCPRICCVNVWILLHHRQQQEGEGGDTSAGVRIPRSIKGGTQVPTHPQPSRNLQQVLSPSFMLEETSVFC